MNKTIDDKCRNATAGNIIVVACDDNYAPYAAAVLLSAGQHLPGSFQCGFVIATYGLQPPNKAWFERVELLTGRPVTVLEFPRTYESFPSGRYTSTMYLRYELADKLPHAIRMLYLDCDILVRASLEPLLTTDLGNKWFAAMRDAADIFGGPFQEHKSNLGLPKEHIYFNSGVLLANLEAWRTAQVRNKLLDVLKASSGKLRFPDQDVLNVTSVNRVMYLDQKWNVQSSLIATQLKYPNWQPDLTVSITNPSIVHFSEPSKPWTRKKYIPYANEFRQKLHLITGKNYYPNLLTDLVQRTHFFSSLLITRSKTNFKRLILSRTSS